MLEDNERKVEVPKSVKVAVVSKERYPRPKPVVKLSLKYKPMEKITAAPHYLKYVPHVFRDSLNFDFNDKDYEIRERDR